MFAAILNANVGRLRRGCDAVTNVNQAGKRQSHPPSQGDKVLDSLLARMSASLPSSGAKRIRAAKAPQEPST